jgi:hypothetical protein
VGQGLTLLLRDDFDIEYDRMEERFAEVSIKGVIHKLHCVVAGPHSIVSEGRWLKVALIHDEHWRPALIEDPAALVAAIKQEGLKADILTFAQKLPDTQPKFNHHMEWENHAVIPLTTFDEWWEHRLPQETRKNVRRAARRGVTTRVIEFNDSVAVGLKHIYDETPIRQGRKFWHYGKDVQTVMRENASYLDTCEWIGAFCCDELIGVIKMVYGGKAASIMQIISKNEHYDKRPANALLAKAVDISLQKGLTHLIYGQYIYGNAVDNPLTEFKRRNGFEQVLLPRYYIPLTRKGHIALALNLHLGVRRLLPRKIETTLQVWRLKVLQKGIRKQPESKPKPAAVR